MIFNLKDEFIAFWRIIYNLFVGMENESEMYHAAATVSTLLLKLGEVTRKFQHSSSSKDGTNSGATNAEQQQPPQPTSDPTDEWFITFEQLIASLLTDNLLVQYFDAKYDINNKLTEYKSQHA